MQDLSTMTDEQLRALRGDMYQERENMQAAMANYNENIMGINQELARRSATAVDQAAAHPEAAPDNVTTPGKDKE